MARSLDDTVYSILSAAPHHRRKLAVVAVLALISIIVAKKKGILRHPLRLHEKPGATAVIDHPSCCRVFGRQKTWRIEEGGRRCPILLATPSDTSRLHSKYSSLPRCANLGVASREFALLIFLAVSLIARTGLDIWFSAFNGVVVRSIVSRDWELFVKNALILFGVMMWPMSIVNNFLKLTINRLSLSFRSRLTHYAHEEYLKGITFYQVANLDNRIQNADQLLTQVLAVPSPPF